jgi:hypothetical protein
VRWRGARSAILGALALLVLARCIPPVPAVAAATLAGSPHDFSSSGPAKNGLAPRGLCSACHRPHGGDAQKSWSRPLAEERAFFNQVGDPDAAPGSSILCYDCHDDNAERMGTLVDDDPPRSQWVLGHAPQNIAFTDVVPTGATSTPTRPGYYELANGVVPSSGNRGPVDGSPTGGHYWKADRSGTPSLRKGDKIDCVFCHDPHRARTGANEAMLLTATGDGGSIAIGDNLAASPNTRNGRGTGRGMCAGCHGYSRSGSPASYRAVEFPRPPATIGEHLESSATPCTNCHRHNLVSAACDACHANPPTTAGSGWSGPGDTNEHYPGGAGAHLAHLKGAGKSADDPTVYDFGCLGGACHPSTQHNQGSGVVSRANVQVAFDPAWNPNGVFSGGGGALGDACSQLYCHSNGLVENGLNTGDNGTGEEGPSGLGEWAEHGGSPTFFGATPASPATWGGRLGCRGCHGKGDPNYRQMEGTTVTRDTEVAAPAYVNAGEQAFAFPGQVFNTTGANTHFIHVYKLPARDPGGCRCHVPEGQPYPPAPGTAPPGHVNRVVDVPSCGCHELGREVVWGARQFGAAPMTTTCVNWCHGGENAYDSPGGRIVKTGSRQPNELQPKYFESGHGLGKAASYPSGNQGAGLACTDCHLGTDRSEANGSFVRPYHYEQSPAATGNPAAPLSANPYWLKAPYAANPDGLCRSCHNGTIAKGAVAHTSQAMIDSIGYAPKYDASPKCVDCHDPHGEPNWYMLYDGDAEGSYSSRTELYSGPVITKGTRYGVTRQRSDQYGMPPGPDYQSSQVAVTMTDKSSGSDFATGGGRGICEVCHTQTIYYRQNPNNPGGSHETTPCTGCHTHQSAFAPTTCEGCHGRNGNVSPGVNGVAGDADDAPNVMTVNVGGDWLSVWDGTWWDQTQGGDSSAQRGGHGDPRGKEGGDAADTPKCEDCHDIGQPEPNTHFDGVYNSLGMELPSPANALAPRPKANQNANTAHLKTAFFTRYFMGTGNDPSWQLAVDGYCYLECHKTNGVPDMRHGLDALPVPGAVALGTHLTSSTTDLVMDSDLTTRAGGQPHYVPCVSCHNPHGTTVTDTKKNAYTNLMVVEKWRSGFGICVRCHN